jgi:cell wall-associated NlpC family hydrolase
MKHHSQVPAFIDFFARRVYLPPMPRSNRAPEPPASQCGPAGRAILATLLACAALLWGSAASAGPGKRPAEPAEPVARAAAVPDVASLGSEAALRALALVGVPYRWGGSRPATGLDCSGLVHHVFGQIGIATPRDTRGLARSGNSVSRRHLQAGDLVFFNTLRRAYSHVGIYLGDGRFVHAPSAGSEVRIESMASPYWRARYDGARRLGPTDAEATLVASPGRGGGGQSPAPATGGDDPTGRSTPGRASALALGEDVASFYRY